MNCANHPQNQAVAYCRTCGKPLCSNCTRSVAGVIYCENCLAERVAGTAPPAAGFQPGPGYAGTVPRATNSGPNPALAGILGAIPFGVGAIYNGQYAKGLAHLGIFILLAVGANSNIDPLYWICGISIAAFILYQIIDAVKTAKAIQAGQPAPDPFGLGTMFSPGGTQDFAKSVPIGALILIGLGVLFFLGNLENRILNFHTLWPAVLIALGVWLFARRKSLDPSDWRYRSITGPSILITIGVLALLGNLHETWDAVPGWGHTWPLILVVIGVIKLMERGYLGGGPTMPPPANPTGTYSPEQPPAPVNTEVKNG